ncbi:potassium voltage-gated channel subfamily V member 1-like [Lethenteron reissneri]|uniref:potassium voltage-gated channel subfamily V member 1-like n=1 Tax=Lethenteron reissneri TaxID=7753 RepID=UPI002AB70033|nr:potassium voltage-gated channel subfamily V member 1-like [Lethenteron reissneri]
MRAQSTRQVEKKNHFSNTPPNTSTTPPSRAAVDCDCDAAGLNLARGQAPGGAFHRNGLGRPPSSGGLNTADGCPGDRGSHRAPGADHGAASTAIAVEEWARPREKMKRTTQPVEKIPLSSPLMLDVNQISDRVRGHQQTQVSSHPSGEAASLSRGGDGSDELVSINVGGARHSLPCAVLDSYPRSRLGRLAKLWRWRRRRGGGGGGGGQRDAGPGGGGHPHPLQLCDDVGASSEFFFDRSAEAFECVLHFYRTGRLHLRESLCAVSFGQELEYWGLEDALLASCCQDRYARRNAAAADDRGGEDGARRDADRDSDSDGEGGGSERGRCRRLRRAIWATLERPDSSRASRAVAAVSVAFVVLSIANMALVSAPEFAPAAGDDEATALGVLEGVCMAWFTGELALRFACARRKRRFAARFVNIVDLVAIAPFYVTLAVERLAGASTELENVGRVVQVLKLSRSLRMLKLGRHSTGLKALGVTIKQCHEEVGLLLLFFSVGVSIFSVLEYALESSSPGTGFTSVPSAWWWATTSMTTVGYGDVRPDTTAGKLAAFACILSGLLVLALPIAIINDKFAAFYRALRLRDAAERHGRALRGLARAQEDGDTDGDADGDAGPRANLRDVYARHVLGALRGRGDRHSVERL